MELTLLVSLKKNGKKMDIKVYNSVYNLGQ